MLNAERRMLKGGRGGNGCLGESWLIGKAILQGNLVSGKGGTVRLCKYVYIGASGFFQEKNYGFIRNTLRGMEIERKMIRRVWVLTATVHGKIHQRRQRCFFGISSRGGLANYSELTYYA
jgi:hypothetical protein